MPGGWSANWTTTSWPTSATKKSDSYFKHLICCRALPRFTTLSCRFESVIAATGTVLPASEQAVSSPVEARVTRVRRKLGAIVAVGDELVQLDTSAFEQRRPR